MSVYITNLKGFGQNSVAELAQQMVAHIGCQNLEMTELGIKFFNWSTESLEERNARFAGIAASLSSEDTVIFQSPTWIAIEWDNGLIDYIKQQYPRIKSIIFIHDVFPLMNASYRGLLTSYINYYNKADTLIVPSQQMYDFLRKNGLEEKPYVIQHFWDHPCQINYFITPQNNKVINFAGNSNTNKFNFVKTWNNPNIKLKVFSNPKQENKEQNLVFTGWKNDPVLLEELRKSGGFGLIWSEDTYWSEYMKLNTSYKLSTYLASGIPIIVNNDTPEAETIKRKKIGIIANSLAEAQDKMLQITEDEYKELVENVDAFAKLIRGGYFTKKALSDAVFKVRYK